MFFLLLSISSSRSTPLLNLFASPLLVGAGVVDLLALLRFLLGELPIKGSDGAGVLDCRACMEEASYDTLAKRSIGLGCRDE